MRDEIMTQLKDLQAKIAREIGCFPHSCCEQTAMRVERLDIGLEYAHGIFIRSDGFGIEHAWNYCPETDEYVDLTAHQFPGIEADILVLKKGSNKAEELYLEDWHVCW